MIDPDLALRIIIKFRVCHYQVHTGENSLIEVGYPVHSQKEGGAEVLQLAKEYCHK